eukprot:gene2442-2745_t
MWKRKLPGPEEAAVPGEAAGGASSSAPGGNGGRKRCRAEDVEDDVEILESIECSDWSAVKAARRHVAAVWSAWHDLLAKQTLEQQQQQRDEHLPRNWRKKMRRQLLHMQQSLVQHHSTLQQAWCQAAPFNLRTALVKPCSQAGLVAGSNLQQQEQQQQLAQSAGDRNEEAAQLQHGPAAAAGARRRAQLQQKQKQLAASAPPADAHTAEEQGKEPVANNRLGRARIKSQQHAGVSGQVTLTAKVASPTKSKSTTISSGSDGGDASDDSSFNSSQLQSPSSSTRSDSDWTDSTENRKAEAGGKGKRGSSNMAEKASKASSSDIGYDGFNMAGTGEHDDEYRAHLQTLLSCIDDLAVHADGGSKTVAVIHPNTAWKQVPRSAAGPADANSIREIHDLTGAPKSIYQVAREIKKQDASLFNCLNSIKDDAAFVSEIRVLYPDLPLLANLRCGLWYAPRPDGTCCFKSTDGHCGHHQFSCTRLNWHVAELAARKGGCVIVDATRRGKRFPDAMSKTIPIWATVINRAVARSAASTSLGSPNGSSRGHHRWLSLQLSPQPSLQEWLDVDDPMFYYNLLTMADFDIGMAHRRPHRVSCHNSSAGDPAWPLALRGGSWHSHGTRVPERMLYASSAPAVSCLLNGPPQAVSSSCSRSLQKHCSLQAQESSAPCAVQSVAEEPRSSSSRPAAAGLVVEHQEDVQSDECITLIGAPAAHPAAPAAEPVTPRIGGFGALNPAAAAAPLVDSGHRQQQAPASSLSHSISSGNKAVHSLCGLTAEQLQQLDQWHAQGLLGPDAAVGVGGPPTVGSAVSVAAAEDVAVVDFAFPAPEDILIAQSASSAHAVLADGAVMASLPTDSAASSCGGGSMGLQLPEMPVVVLNGTSHQPGDAASILDIWRGTDLEDVASLPRIGDFLPGVYHVPPQQQQRQHTGGAGGGDAGASDMEQDDWLLVQHEHKQMLQMQSAACSCAVGANGDDASRVGEQDSAAWQDCSGWMQLAAAEAGKNQLSPTAVSAARQREMATNAAAAVDWDTALHLPLWVSANEAQAIESNIDGWVERLLEVGADVRGLAALLHKPLRPLWLCQDSLIWTNQGCVTDRALDAGGTRVVRAAPGAFWLGSTGLALGNLQGSSASDVWRAVDAVLCCGTALAPALQQEYQAMQYQAAARPAAMLVPAHSAANHGTAAGDPHQGWVCSSSAPAVMPGWAAGAGDDGVAVCAGPCASSSFNVGFRGSQLPRLKWLPIEPSKKDRSSLKQHLQEALEFVSAHLAAGHLVLLHDVEGGHNAAVNSVQQFNGNQMTTGGPGWRSQAHTSKASSAGQVSCIKRAPQVAVAAWSPCVAQAAAADVPQQPFPASKLQHGEGDQQGDWRGLTAADSAPAPAAGRQLQLPHFHHPAQVTKWIGASSTVQQLEQLHQQLGPQLNPIHLSAMLVKLARLSSTTLAAAGSSTPGDCHAGLELGQVEAQPTLPIVVAVDSRSTAAYTSVQAAGVGNAAVGTGKGCAVPAAAYEAAGKRS